MRGRRIAVASAVAALSLGSAAAREGDAAPAPTATALAQALKDFLNQRGDICLAKYEWPIDVSDRDVAAGTRDARQLPVMERLGLVESESGFMVYRDGDKQEKVPARRYKLTALGMRSYKVRETSARPHGGPVVVHHGDLCAGHIEFNALVSIHVPAAQGGRAGTASVNYRYRFTPEPWVDNEAIRTAFPMLDQIIKGQVGMEMTQNFHFDGSAWVADSAIE